MTALEHNIYSAQSVRGVGPEACTFQFHSIADALLRQQVARAQSTYLISYDEANSRIEYSYDDFVKAVLRTASYLQSIGVSSGSRVLTAAHNHHDTIIQYFAAWSLQACIVPLNMSEDDERLRYICSNCNASVLLCRPDYAQRIASLDLPSSLHCVLVSSKYHELVASMPECQVSTEPALDAECLIVYTSGTTGNPKGVVLLQRNLMADGEGIAAWHGITADQRMMCVLPVHHVNGTIVTHVTPFLAGASVVLLRKFQTELFFKRIRDESVHIVSVVPTLLAFLLEADVDDLGVTKSGFRHIICGAGPLTCELAQRFEDRYSIMIMHGYGLSETTCYSCFLETDLSADEHRYWMSHFGFPSIGASIPQNEMQIHDEHGRPLASMERGEIVIRGWNVMKEYYNNESANKSTFEFGWFRSGDEGFWAARDNGTPYFFITGRIKELIIRGGVNIAPLEIDEVINCAPGVKAGISVGFVNDFYGEEIGALVVAHEGASEENILRFCQEQLPFSKAPKVVLFSETLPVTSTGKYQRNKVKHLFAEWKEAQFRKSK